MKVLVVFEYPDITDSNSPEADQVVAILTHDLKKAGIDCDSWNIEEAYDD